VVQYWVHKRLKQQADKNKHYLDQQRHAKHVEFQAGDPVYLRNHQRSDKLDDKWLPHFRVLRHLGHYAYEIQNQLSGKVRKAHAQDLSLAKDISNWEPKTNVQPKRRARNVILDDSSDEESVGSVEEPSDAEVTSENLSEDTDLEQTENQVRRPSRIAKMQAADRIQALSMNISPEQPVVATIAELFHLFADGLTDKHDGQTD
jgi:hypothetical protein